MSRVRGPQTVREACMWLIMGLLAAVQGCTGTRRYQTRAPEPRYREP